MSKHAGSKCILICGAHELPAVAGDPSGECLESSARQLGAYDETYALCLGRVPAGGVPAVKRVDATPENMHEVLREVRDWLEQTPTLLLTLLLSAPLRFHKDSWWACGIGDREPYMFNLLQLVRELKPRDRRKYQLVVHPAFGWHCATTGAPLDVPDDSVVAEWQQQLEAGRVRCTCALASVPGQYLPHDPRCAIKPAAASPKSFENFLTFEALAQLKNERIVVVSADHRPGSWYNRLTAFLSVLGIQFEQFSRRRTQPSSIVVVLEQRTLSDANFAGALESWRGERPTALLLLDLVETHCTDAWDKWRIKQPWRRGPWRALDQALWLARSSSARATEVEPENLRSTLQSALAALAHERGPSWNDITRRRDSWLQTPDHACLAQWLEWSTTDLQKRFALALSVLSASNDLCFVERRSAPWTVLPEFASVLEHWDTLRCSVDPKPSDPDRALPKPAMRLTYAGDRGGAVAAFEELLAWRHEVECNDPLELVEGAAVPAAPVDYWFHVDATPEPSAADLSTLHDRSSVVLRGRIGSMIGDRYAVSTEEAKVLGHRFAEAYRSHSRTRRVFISHSSRDRERVFRLIGKLEANGIRCVLAPRDMLNGRVLQGICDLIDGCQAVVAAFSRQSAESDWVEAEIKHAEQLELRERRAILCVVQFDKDPWKAREKLTGAGSKSSTRHVVTLESLLEADEYERRITSLVASLQHSYGVKPDRSV